MLNKTKGKKDKGPLQIAGTFIQAKADYGFL